ncbi:F-box DNA helicase 1 [Rhinophrynus dorsalis]
MKVIAKQMRRRKHLTEWDCQKLAQSREGSSSLTQPFSQRRTSRDVNLGLYPLSRTERWARGRASIHFQKYTTACESTGVADTSSVNQSEIPVNVQMTDLPESEDELFSNHMDEILENDSLSQPSPSRKRPFSSAGCEMQDSKQCCLGIKDQKPSSSSFFEDNEEADDEEMVHILDLLPDSCYGLLGTPDHKDLTYEHINKFPVELIQCIFGFLPIVDLYKNVSLVCRQWKDLVSNPLFIPWKKLYHQYLGKEARAVCKVDHLLKRNLITPEQDLCVLNLIRYFAALKCPRMEDQGAALGCLKCHHLYPLAEVCITQQMPELGNAAESVNPWAVFAVIVLLSNEVSDIQRLMRCLRQSSSTVRLVEITEALYCLATLLFAMREQKILISNRLHYNIMYCLYLLENSSSQDKTSRPSFGNSRHKVRLNLTNEQRQIINHDIAPGQVVKIMAFAGTGKTSTLIKYAEKRPGLRFLYATFNKSITQHATSLFPNNVICKTFHSLAYAELGILYRKCNKLNPFKLTSFAVNMVLPEGKGGFIRAKLIVKTLETFFSSADEMISEEHVPLWYKNSHGIQTMVTHEENQFTVWQATEIWEKMKRLVPTRDNAYKMTHDGYLKLWQLHKPCLSAYDAIFVDEAQDCTPAIMEVVLSQPCGKIFVGDPHQQIYTFRGAVNALFEVPHTHIFYLTQSFRFGAEIAYVGATILDVCKKVRHKTLVGGNQKGTIHGHCQDKVAILSRTNSCVFDEAVRLTEGENPSRIHIIGGPENFGLNKILDIWILLQPEGERMRQRLYITDPYIKMWAKNGGYAALKNYAVSSEDKELEAKIAVVEKYNIRIPELVNRIKNCNTLDDIFADYILGTVHKAKGMEFDTVQVTDDFAKIPAARHNLERLQIPFTVSVEDEWNLLYVAVTRAKKNLIMTKSIENIITLAGEYFLKAELSSQVFKDGPVVCALDHCKNSLLEQTPLTMRKLPWIYSGNKEDKGGYICHACVQQRVGPITHLMASADLVGSLENNLENVVLPRNYELLFEVI